MAANAQLLTQYQDTLQLCILGHIHDSPTSNHFCDQIHPQIIKEVKMEYNNYHLCIISIYITMSG